MQVLLFRPVHHSRQGLVEELRITSGRTALHLQLCRHLEANVNLTWTNPKSPLPADIFPPLWDTASCGSVKQYYLWLCKSFRIQWQQWLSQCWKGQCTVSVKPLLPENLSSSFGVTLGLHDGKGFLLLAHLLQPLLLQKRHQRVSHVHHLQHLLKDVFFLHLLLWCLVYQMETRNKCTRLDSYWTCDQWWEYSAWCVHWQTTAPQCYVRIDYLCCYTTSGTQLPELTFTQFPNCFDTEQLDDNSQNSCFPYSVFLLPSSGQNLVLPASRSISFIKIKLIIKWNTDII